MTILILLLPALLLLLFVITHNKALGAWVGREFSRVDAKTWDVATKTARLRSDINDSEVLLKELRKEISRGWVTKESILESLERMPHTDRAGIALLELEEAAAHGFIFPGGEQEKELKCLKERYIAIEETSHSLKEECYPGHHILNLRSFRDSKTIVAVRKDIEYNIGRRLAFRFVAVCLPLLLGVISLASK